MNFSNIKKSYFLLIPALIFTICSLCACTGDAECNTSTASFFRISFYKKVRSNLLLKKEVENLQLESVTTPALPNYIFYSDTTVHKMILPIDPHADSISFVFSRLSRPSQEIVVYYKNVSRILSPDCGVERVISLERFSNPELDSVNIVKTVLQNNDTLHIEIYL